MKNRIITMLVLSTTLLYSCGAHPPNNVQNSTTSKLATNDFLADRFGFLASSESKALTAQANLGVYSASKIQPLRPPKTLKAYRTVFNTSAILTSFQLTKIEVQNLNTMVDNLLKNSNRVTVTTTADAHLAIYSTVSIKRQEVDTAILEVMLGVSDWSDAKARKGNGAIAALSKSTVWINVTRRKLSWQKISAAGKPSFEKLAPELATLYKSGIKHILLTVALK